MAFTSFVNSLTNSPIQPSNATYLEITAASSPVDVTLEWAFINPSTSYPFSNLIKITGAPTSVFTITLPSAVYTGLAQFTIFYNATGSDSVAGQDITINDASGNFLGTLTPFTSEVPNCFYVGCTDNSTAAGTWAFITFGTASSSVMATDLIDPGTSGTGEPAAGGLKAVASATTEELYLKLNQYVFDYTNTTYAGNSYDRGNIVNWTSESGGTYTLLAAATAGNGFVTGLINSSQESGTITITPSGSDLINTTESSVLLQAGESTLLISDGSSNWYTFCLSNNIVYAITQNQTNLENSGGSVTIDDIGAANQIQTFYNTYNSSTTTVPVTLPAGKIQQYFINNTSTTNPITIQIVGDSAPYIYTILPGGALTTFTDGVHLYSSTIITLANGTSALPSLNFQSNATTGIYRDSSTGSVAIVEAGTIVTFFNATAQTVYVPLNASSLVTGNAGFDAEGTTTAYNQFGINTYSIARAYGV